jgi:hypothetical protein
MNISLEQIFKIIVVGTLLFYAVLASTVFEVKYSNQLIAMYPHPWWRLLLVLFIALGWRWSPLIGVLIAIIVFFYLHDMYILTAPSR